MTINSEPNPDPDAPLIEEAENSEDSDSQSHQASPAHVEIPTDKPYSDMSFKERLESAATPSNTITGCVSTPPLYTTATTVTNITPPSAITPPAITQMSAPLTFTPNTSPMFPLSQGEAHQPQTTSWGIQAPNYTTTSYPQNMAMLPPLAANWWGEQIRQMQMYQEHMMRELQRVSTHARLPGPQEMQGAPSTNQVNQIPGSVTRSQGGPPANSGRMTVKPYRPAALLAQSKFTPRLAQAEFPKKTKMPSTIGKYDGSTDPDDHVNVFVCAGGIEQWEEHVWCHMFIQTLVGAARLWYDSLPKGGIDSFDELLRKFMQQFSQQKRHTKDMTEILHIKRRDDEPLADFITRYNLESLQIGGVTEDLMIAGFVNGVRDDHLIRRLHGPDGMPRTMETLMNIAKMHIKAEKSVQLNRTSGKQKETWKSTESRGKDSQKPYKNEGRHQRHNERAQSSFTKEWSRPYAQNRPELVNVVAKHAQREKDSGNFYASLTKSPGAILASGEIKFSTPAPLKEGIKRDTNKYCEYHKGHGHETDRCWQLRKQIEENVANGKLSHLLKDKRGAEHRSHEKESISQKRPRDFYMIRSDHHTQPRGTKRHGEILESWMDAPLVIPPSRGNRFVGPLTITALIGDYNMRRVFIDTGCCSEIMYEQCFEKLDPEDRARLEHTDGPLTGFSGETVTPLGKIEFAVTIGEAGRQKTALLTFIVIPATSRHNVIFGRTALDAFDAAVSTRRGLITFPTPRGIARIYADDPCMVAEARIQEPQKNEHEKWVINKRFPEQPITLGATLSPTIRHHLKDLLYSYMDVFAFEPTDMTGVPRGETQHRLRIKESAIPVAQKRRNMGNERRMAVVKEVQKLVEAGILREVRRESWVANPVMVKKSDGTWRMCVDYTDLNKACTKDSFPLPNIDAKIDSLAPYRYKCFLDAYKGYHQIKMAREDEDKTAFHTDIGIFCYTKMPFGLKNAGATYQKFMDKIFKEQIDKNLEVYVDDLVIKSREERTMLTDISETFLRLRKFNVKLNPKKCSFGMEEGRFLGVVVTNNGLKVNQDKVDAILKMASPSTLKEVQVLSGRLVSINRFLSKHAERSLPFLDTLKNCISKKQFKWTSEAEAAFQEMKKHLAHLPTLATPMSKETLKIYLAAANRAVSAVLVVERKGVQTPIYYVSRVLTQSEANYTMMEKLVLALVHASRRLKRYFEDHPIEVLTSVPLQQVLKRPEISGRLAKWAIELGTLEITYKPRTAIKGQVLADFIAETPEGTKVIDPTPLNIEVLTKLPAWQLHTDGASCKEGAGIGLLLVSPEGVELTHAIKLGFKTSNNETEYEALIAGLRLAIKVEAHNLKAHVDSLLVANQINGMYEAKDPTMIKYLNLCKELITKFRIFEIVHVPRGQNKKADALSKVASCFTDPTKEIRVEELAAPSIQVQEFCMTEPEEESWMSPIKRYLSHGELPEARDAAHKIKCKALHYQLQDNVLYRRSYLGPLLRCVTDDEANYLIREIHTGICGIHAGPRAVVAKITNAGYYWPGMHNAAVQELRKCTSCQRYAPMALRPKNDLVPVTTAWPFQKWAVDIVGPFPEVAGRVKHLIVGVDYFTKWTEAKPLATISAVQVKKFLWEHIVCRFGVPLCLVTDNGPQFADKKIQEWCGELHVQHIFTSVAHPQGNGQVERINRSLVEGIKKRLDQSGASWVEELPNVLWAHRTMTKTSNGETPFSLTYGSEAVIPAEIGIPSARTLNAYAANNDQELRSNLDLLEERREIAAIKEAKYKARMEKDYNKKVRKCSFKQGDFVLRSNQASRAEAPGKLSPNWEGPYIITQVIGKGAYSLSRLDGKAIPRTWNAAQLRKCYM
ncbi:hypothetical protein QVD17_26662 [Tagetes erecta]|uniref:Uncharacterized protein n=1 Tax=Tagetes erecta TaxID=13708 RepID=A0AAD8K9G7_TARER|nr:hypothetical protein QVD17_26662 [Tagetes erecta]